METTATTAAMQTARVIIVAGIACGLVVAGIGSRLAMMLLRITSGSGVHGLQSDDDFRIGQVTLAGTYALLALGAGVGIIGACTYLLVRTWLIGPRWFRRTTVGLASGAVAGAILLHDDGIDFHLLTPTWLAMGLFVALPALFGVAMEATVEAVDRSPVDTRSVRFWLVPLILVAMVPFVLVTLVFVIPGVVVVTAVSHTGFWRTARSLPALRLAVRAGWLAIAALGATALLNDIVAIT